MKLQLDSENKIIKVEGTVKLQEFFKQIKQLLPKDSPLGSWEEYTLEANTVIYNWNYPITVTHCSSPWITYTTYPVDTNVLTATQSIYNLEIN